MINVVKKVTIDKNNGIYLKKYDSFTPFVLGYSKVIKDNRISYIDIYGNEVILTEEQLHLMEEYSKIKEYNTRSYQDIDYIGFNSDKSIGKYEHIRDFREGYAVIIKDRKYGYIDENDQFLVKPKYNYASDFKDGIAVVRDDKWGIINSSGYEIFPCIASEIMNLNYNRVYIDGYMYDLANIKLKYVLTINIDNNCINREFNTRSELETYEKILYATIFDIVKKCDNKKIKKLTIDN